MCRSLVAAVVVTLGAAWLPLNVFAQSQVFTFEQGVSSYSGFADTTIFSEADNSGGGTDGIFSGTINQLTFDGNTRQRRALIRLDLSTIPPGWIVESVSLQMTVEMSGGNFGDIDYTLHPLTKDWGEGTVVGPSEGGFGAPAEAGDATWQSNRHTISLWNTPGGDFVAMPSATAAAGTSGTDVVWSSAQMVADVQEWVNIPALNYGWIIISTIEGQRQRVKKFYSSEAAISRPVITIVASPGPPIDSGTNLTLFLLTVILGSLGVSYILRTTL